MRVLITNDDGIFSHSLWTLAEQFSKHAEVLIVAPDREQSACGTAVTLRRPLRVQKVAPLVAGIEAYAIDGTPSDSTIFALGNFGDGAFDYVISGINQGANLGDDVLISGTVSAALQGYLRGIPSIAVSVTEIESNYYKHAAELTALLAVKLKQSTNRDDIFINLNYPDLSKEKVKGLNNTSLAHKTHIDTVKKMDSERYKNAFWLVRQRLGKEPHKDTDIYSISHGFASVTEMHSHLFNREPLPLSKEFCDELYREFLLS